MGQLDREHDEMLEQQKEFWEEIMALMDQEREELQRPPALPIHLEREVGQGSSGD
jgi:hypothetical protein